MFTDDNSKLKDFIKIYFGTFISLILGFIKSFVVANILGPTQFGFWKIIELVQTYGPVLNLGIGNGVNREIPYWNGKGDLLYVNKIKNTGLFSILATSVFCIVFFILTGFLFEEELTRFAVQISGLILAFSQLYWYQLVLQYSDKQFSKASLFLIINAIISLFITIILVYEYKIYGQLIAVFVAPFIMILLIQLVIKTNYRFEWDLGVFKRISSIGFPIMFVGILHGVVYSIDRILILHFFDLTTLGYYGLGIMLLTFLSAIPDSVSKIIYPRMNEYVGKFENAKNMDQIVLYPAIGLNMFMPIIISLTIILLPIFVSIFLPNYKEGIFAAQVLIIGLGVSGVNILHAIMKQKLYLLLQIVAVVVNVVLAIIFINIGLGLTGIALASTLSIILYRVLPTIYSLYFMEKRIKYIFKFTVLTTLVPISVSSIVLILLRNYQDQIILPILLILMILTGIVIIWINAQKRNYNFTQFVLMKLGLENKN